MNGDLLAPLMFVVVFILIFTGFPVAFALGGTALLFAVIGVSAGFFDWALMYALPERIFGIMSNFVLLAIPFFIFMGTVLEKSRLAEDLLLTIGKLFGPVRGGLAMAEAGCSGPGARVVGNEGAGIRAELRDAAHASVGVPIRAHAESLNAGVAAAILCYELSHAPLQRPPPPA